MNFFPPSVSWQTPLLAHILRSTTPDPSLSELDVCTILMCALSAVRMELVDDRSIPLETQIRTNFDKLCAYYRKSHKLRGIAEFGFRFVESNITAADLVADPQLYHQHKIRKAYFHQVKQVLYGQFHSFLRYGLIAKMPELRYDVDNDITIESEVFYQPYTPFFDRKRPPRNVCWPGDKEPVLEPEPQNLFQFTESDVKRFGKPINFTEPGSNLAAHHIISLNLMNEFFQIHAELEKVGKNWKTEFPIIDNRFFNIFNHSQRKLLTIKLWTMYSGSDPLAGIQTSAPPQFPSNARMDDVEKFVDQLGRVFMWSTGANLFVGPLAQERGPFDPCKRGLDFEYDAKPILSEQKYQTAFKLYQRIDQFLKLEPKKRTLCDSNDIYNSIYEYYLMFDITPYNKDQWEKRIPTEEELNLWPKSLAKKNRGKEFWAIKREDLQLSTSIRRPCTSIENDASPQKRRCCNKE